MVIHGNCDYSSSIQVLHSTDVLRNDSLLCCIHACIISNTVSILIMKKLCSVLKEKHS